MAGQVYPTTMVFYVHTRSLMRDIRMTTLFLGICLSCSSFIYKFAFIKYTYRTKKNAHMVKGNPSLILGRPAWREGIAVKHIFPSVNWSKDTLLQ